MTRERTGEKLVPQELLLKFLPEKGKTLPENSCEPAAVFIYDGYDGDGKTEERLVRYTDLRNGLSNLISQAPPLESRLKQLHITLDRWRKKGKTPSGKPYSSAEKNQILAPREAEESRLRRVVKQNKITGRLLTEIAKWVVVSPREKLLTIRIEDKGKNEFEGKPVLGEPLSEDEAAWRVFVFTQFPQLWGDPSIELAKQYFLLRRTKVLGSTDRAAEAEEALEKLRAKADSPSLSPEMIFNFRLINAFDFKKPLLPELETLRRLSR